MKIHPSYLLLGFALGIIFGSIISVALPVGLKSGWWSVLGLFLLLLSLISQTRFFLPLSVIGGLLVIFQRAGIELKGREALSLHFGQNIKLSGIIMEDPNTTPKNTTLKLNHLTLFNQKIPGIAFVTTKPDPSLERSDLVSIEGTTSPGFGIYSGMIKKAKLTDIAKPSPPDLTLKFRKIFSSKVRQFLPADEAGLGLGYLLGEKTNLSPDLTNKLRIVGLTHIVVASGANLAILISFARKVFGKISRWAGFFISLLLVIFYVVMVGFSPSMLRAGLVATLSLIAWYFGRKFNPLKLLILVMGITLLYQPYYPLDLGWQLSFASFTGILLLGPRLTSYLYGEKSPNLLGATFSETLSASILCLPLIFYSYGATSLISLLANLLILPTIPLAMFLVFVTGLFGFTANFLPLITNLIGWLATKVINYHLLIINFFGRQEFFEVSLPKNNPLVFLAYLPIVFLLLKPKIKSLFSIKNNIKICRQNPTH